MRELKTAYPLLDARNWASLQTHGLLSTQRRVALRPESAGGILRRHCVTRQRLAEPTIDDAVADIFDFVTDVIPLMPSETLPAGLRSPC